MTRDGIKETIDSLTLNPDNVMNYQEEDRGYLWNECMKFHSELHSLFDEVIGSGDHGGDYANFLERLGLHFQTDAGWWNKTAVDKDNIFAFIMYQLGEDEDELMNSDIDFIMDLLNKIPKKYLRLNDNHVNIYHLIKEYRSR
jgi:hypothetical protein